MHPTLLLAPLAFHVADVDYSFNTNLPPQHESFIPGTGSTAKRANELHLNVGALDIGTDPDPVGFRLILVAGSGPDVIHSGDLSGAGAGPDVWRHVLQASVTWKSSFGLTIEGGIMPAHVGYEVFFSKDNWSYTRSWMSELSPFYETGVRATYAITDELSAGVYFVNGWQTIGGISGASQKLAEGTGTAEWRPLPTLTLPLEGRYDHSAAPVFFGHDLDPEGGPTFEQHQVLFVLGAVAHL